MSKLKNRVFVISKKFGGIKHYLVRESGANGIFSADLKDAKKFLDLTIAKIWASGYEESEIETIKEGEVLK